MAALLNLGVSVAKATPIDDQTTYQYHIQLQDGGAKWEVTKRFSEFDVLLQSLSSNRYAALPKLPSKTLLGSPTDKGAIDSRKEQLRIILQDLLVRPDTRTSLQLRQFLNIDSHCDPTIRPILPDPVRTFEDPRFGVSGLSVAPRANLLLVTHEDSTHLSRLGRVWSVVEPDELGALHIWGQTADGTWRRTYTRTVGIKVRSLCWEEETRQFFVGLEDGKIEVYRTEAETLQPTQLAVLELHHKSPVTYLCASRRRLLSIGFDTAMRVIDIKTRELVCGGRLLKRLRSEMHYLTSAYLNDDQDRAFIGTSGGDLFILDIQRNPPNFLHTLQMTEDKPVSAIVVFKENLLVAHNDCVCVFTFEKKGVEKRMSRLGCHRAKYLHSSEVSILSIAAAPERDLIFGGFSDGSVAVWSTHESEAFMVLQAHQCDTSVLVWLGCAPWGPALYSGGGDGKVTMWTLGGSPEDYVFWTPQGLDGEILALTAPLPMSGTGDALVPFTGSGGFGGGADDLLRVDNPRVNPQALKGEDDSDSDNDDIADAFK